MTNDDKLKWLNEMNAHLAAGGKLRYHDYIDTVTPSWNSDPNDWEIVPLPRMAVIRVAYMWTDKGEFISFLANPGSEAGWKYKEIEVSDE
jgi:hypothetical protein